MNFVTPQSVNHLMVEAQELNLYTKLITQINKDFTLANETLVVTETALPNDLFNIVQHRIYYLLHHEFAQYLNLLYIIDVAEDAIKKLDGSDLLQLSKEVAFLILKREWQKVWFRNFY